MPSVQVTSKDCNSEVEKNGDRITQQPLEKVGKTEQPVKMPCNPSTASQSPPPTDEELNTHHHGNNIHSNNGATVEEAKSKMAKEAHPSVDRPLQPDDLKTSSGQSEDVKVSVDTKPCQTTKTGQRKSKPKIFELLNTEVKCHGRLEKHRSVTSSYEKETHVLTHAVSAPGALSNCKESSLKDQVFDDEETREKNTADQSKNIPQEGKQVDAETKPQEQMKKNNIRNKDGQKDGTEERDDEKLDVGKDDSRQEHPEKNSSDIKPQVDKVDAGVKETTEDVSSDADDKKKEKEKDEEEVKKTVGDIDSLTQSLQTNLKLDDGKKAEETKSKDVEVSNLAKDIQSMSLREKASASASGRSGLRAKGIQDMGPIIGPIMGRPDGNLKSHPNYVFGGYHQNQPASHFPPAQPWQTQTQPHFQTQSLPPFKVFKRTHGYSQGQAQQSVVSPPGQGNFQPIYLKPTGTVHKVQGPAITQSKQGQFAQNTLFPQPQNQAYPMNDLSAGGLSFQSSEQKMPEESTWPCPLTPESITDMIDNMTSDEESVKSPVENEEPMQSGGLMDFLPSPQSPWQTSSSVASAFSPQHSPYAEQMASSVASSLSPQHSPYQEPQESPLQLVPDVSPWTPDSNVGSPGESLPPESPTYNIQIGMTAGTMTVQDRAPLAPRAPNLQEMEEKRIHEIKTMLMTDSDPSQSPPHFYQGPPQQERQFLRHYHMDPSTQMPAVSPPTSVMPTSAVTQHTPSQVYPPGVTPYIGELEAFKALVAEHSMEVLMETDEDNDTVLHLSICKDKVALSVAIIERLWMEKRSLDILNKLHQTPLYLSVVCKLHILTEILINYRASLRIGNKDGNTPLHAAAMTGNTEAIKTIIRCMSYSGYSYPETCALFDATNFEGKTALMVAIEAHCESVNCAETVKELLMSNANPMVPDDQSGKTALHYAVELQKMDLIYILLEECQDASRLVNSKMYNGNTALHLIVGRAIPETHILRIVGMLMNRGANVSISNDANEKPCDLVRREHCQVKHHLHGQEHHKR